jgi:hypothetical protein
VVLWGLSGEKASIFEIFRVFFKELGYFVQISHETMTGFTRPLTTTSPRTDPGLNRAKRGEDADPE